MAADAKRERHPDGLAGGCEQRAHSFVVVLLLLLCCCSLSCTFSACRAVQKNLLRYIRLAQLPPLAKPVQAQASQSQKNVQAQLAGGWVFVADLPLFAQNKIVQASTVCDAWVVFAAGHRWL